MSGRAVYDRYQSTAVNTSKPRHLIVMLHHGGVKQLNLAERQLAGRDFEAANQCLLRAQDIVREISLAFAEDDGDELVQAVTGLYAYMYRRLIEANRKKDAATVIAVRDMLKEMAEAWMRAGCGTEDEDREGGSLDASG